MRDELNDKNIRLVVRMLNLYTSHRHSATREGVRSPTSATCTGFGVRKWKLITACFWPIGYKLKLFIHITP